MKGLLNPRQAAFAVAYGKHGVGERAALEAGYSRKTARSQAQRLLTKVGVRAEIDRLAKLTEKDTIADLVEIREMWTKTMRNEAEEVKNKIKASELLAKTLGGFIERVQVSKGVPISVDELV